MLVSEFLSEATIKVGLEAQTKVAAIHELVDLLVEEHEVSLANRSSVIQTVLKREEVVSTGMEYGVAIPHGAVDSVDDIVAALGISHAGIDFESMDGKPAHIIILLLLPGKKYSSSVRTMAGISRLLTQAELRQRVLNAETPEAVMEIIIEEEERQFQQGTL